MDDAREPFLMLIEDVFRRERGCAVLAAGRIERGRVLVGDEVQIVGGEPTGTPVRVAGIEGPGRTPTRVGEAGRNAGLLLPHSVADTVVRGRMLAQPGTIGAHSHFAASLALLPEEQGGAEVRTGDALVFHFGADGVRGTVTLPPGTDVLHPCHTARVTITLGEAVALENGWSFAFRFRARAAGTGTVTALVEAAPRTAP